jgi:hypothetical protein
VPILPKWPDDTDPIRLFPIGVGGSSVPVAGARRRLALRGSHEIDMVVTGTEGRWREETPSLSGWSYGSHLGLTTKNEPSGL